MIRKARAVLRGTGFEGAQRRDHTGREAGVNVDRRMRYVSPIVTVHRGGIVVCRPVSSRIPSYRLGGIANRPVTPPA